MAKETMSVAELEQHAVTNAQLAPLLAAFQEAIKTIVQEIRKPPVDPVKEIAAARQKATKEAAEASYWQKIRDRKYKLCSHMRQNGTSNIAWAVQSDGIKRGVCPYCESTFTPDDGELYQQLLKVPSGMVEAVRYV